MGRPKNVHLAAELSDDPETFDAETLEPLAAPPRPGPVAPPAQAQPDMAALIAGLTAALQTGMAGAIEQAKDKPRSREDWEFERKSVYNPLGDLNRPRPELECPTYYGVINEEDPSKAPDAYMEMPDGTMTFEELTIANALPPMSTTIELNDGTKVPFQVYVKRDAVTGTPSRKLLCLPQRCYGKDLRNMVPNLRRLWAQVQESMTAA